MTPVPGSVMVFHHDQGQSNMIEFRPNVWFPEGSTYQVVGDRVEFYNRHGAFILGDTLAVFHELRETDAHHTP